MTAVAAAALGAPAAQAATATDFGATLTGSGEQYSLTLTNPTNVDLSCFATFMSAVDTRTYERSNQIVAVPPLMQVQAVKVSATKDATVALKGRTDSTGGGVTVGCFQGTDSATAKSRYAYAPAPLHAAAADDVARKIVTMFMAEKKLPPEKQGHYRNVINPVLTHVGHGVGVTPAGKIYVVQEFAQLTFTS